MVVAPSYHPFGIYDSDALMFYKAIILSGFASYNPEGVEPLYKAILSSAVSSLRDLCSYFMDGAFTKQITPKGWNLL